MKEIKNGNETHTRLYGNERGRDDHAVVAKLCELSVQAITAWTSLIAEMKLPPISPELVSKLANMISAVRDRAPVPHFAASLALGKRHRNRSLMDIQPDKHDILQLVSPPFLRLGASQSGATLEGECRGKDHQTSQLTLRSWGLTPTFSAKACALS
nr:hypothetical protein [Pseudorhodobacter ferrugineus]